MVQTLLSLTEARDAETGRHSRRTQQYTRLLAGPLSTHPAFRDYLTRERIDLLASLAPLHDIGKVGVSDRVLNKPGPLTPEEAAEMRSHPELGRDVILRAEARVGVRDDVTLQMAKDIVYTHHERWDGTGYPQGLRGTDIPIPGRIMAVVDVYDAVRARSLYCACRSHEETVNLIVAGKHSHFDPDVVDAFLLRVGLVRGGLVRKSQRRRRARDRFSARNSPDLPALTTSMSPSPSMSRTAICSPPPALLP